MNYSISTVKKQKKDGALEYSNVTVFLFINKVFV